MTFSSLKTSSACGTRACCTFILGCSSPSKQTRVTLPAFVPRGILRIFDTFLPHAGCASVLHFFPRLLFAIGTRSLSGCDRSQPYIAYIPNFRPVHAFACSPLAFVSQEPVAEPDQETGEGRAAAGSGVLVQQEEVPGVCRGAQQRHAHHRQVSELSSCSACNRDSAPLETYKSKSRLQQCAHVYDRNTV